MYFKLLSALAIIEIAWGTIFSVLGIIKMSFKDVSATQTCAAFDSVDESTLLQRYYARCGIAYIIVGSLLQIYLVFVTPNVIYEFIMLLLFFLIIPTAIFMSEKKLYKLELIKIRNGKNKG